VTRASHEPVIQIVGDLGREFAADSEATMRGELLRCVTFVTEEWGTLDRVASSDQRSRGNMMAIDPPTPRSRG